MKADRATLVAYRLEQTDEALDSARLLLENAKLRSSLSRSYYAMFYAVLALLAQEGHATSKHAGAIAAFDREFVKQSLFDREFSRWLHEAFDLRQRSDYRELFTVSRERVSQVLDNAEHFASGVRTYLETGDGSGVPRQEPQPDGG